MMNVVHQGGPVFYASLSRDSESCRDLLIATLWEHLLSTEIPLWKRCQSSGRAALPIQVAHDRLGRPYTLSGELRGPAISFSESGGTVWAALCGDDADIGIDVAGADEFDRDYPLQRVFHPAELHHALRLTGGDVADASALLWSVKEAAVKALGCAFHRVNPQQVNVKPLVARAAGGRGYIFPVGLSEKAGERFPPATGRSVWVHSLSQGRRWLSIARVMQRPAVNE